MGIRRNGSCSDGYCGASDCARCGSAYDYFCEGCKDEISEQDNDDRDGRCESCQIADYKLTIKELVVANDKLRSEIKLLKKPVEKELCTSEQAFWAMCDDARKERLKSEGEK